MSDLANRIYSNGQVAETMKEYKFIVILMNKGAVERSKHMTIIIMSQIGKTILKVRNVWLERGLEETVYDVQFGFRKGVGTKNPTLMSEW